MVQHQYILCQDGRGLGSVPSLSFSKKPVVPGPLTLNLVQFHARYCIFPESLGHRTFTCHRRANVPGTYVRMELDQLEGSVFQHVTFQDPPTWALQVVSCPTILSYCQSAWDIFLCPRYPRGRVAASRGAWETTAEASDNERLKFLFQRTVYNGTAGTSICSCFSASPRPFLSTLTGPFPHETLDLTRMAFWTF